ncbi:hypothetical protein ES703_50795 [subsurface metagenome]
MEPGPQPRRNIKVLRLINLEGLGVGDYDAGLKDGVLDTRFFNAILGRGFGPLIAVSSLGICSGAEIKVGDLIKLHQPDDILRANDIDIPQSIAVLLTQVKNGRQVVYGVNMGIIYQAEIVLGNIALQYVQVTEKPFCFLSVSGQNLYFMPSGH